MPRARVKLSAPPAVEPPPDWWALAWAKRQADVRARIPLLIVKADRALAASEIRQGLSSVLSGAEISHALGVMVESGVLRRFERTEPSCFGNGTATRTYTYYDLAKE